MEKLQAVVRNAPETQIKLVAIQISDAVREFVAPYNTIIVEERAYQIADIRAADLVIAAVNDLQVAQQVREDTITCEKLVNVADKPELCDFYLFCC